MAVLAEVLAVTMTRIARETEQHVKVMKAIFVPQALMMAVEAEELPKLEKAAVLLMMVETV
tara:strand:- start:366 stop:548 length:183 start_codon:yes stop_codon:yes gene_type:complete